MTKKALFLAGGWEGHEPQETSRFISNEEINSLVIESGPEGLEVIFVIIFFYNDKVITV